MASAVRQKWEEAHYVERLRGSLAELGEAAIEPDEEPDFLAAVGNRVIGIELTAIVRNGGPDVPSPKERFVFQRRAEATARRLFMEAGHRPAWVQLRWLPNRTRAPLDDVAQALADVVAAYGPDALNDIESRDVECEDLPAILQDHVHSLTVTRSPTDRYTTWTAGFASYPEVDRAEIVREVRRKQQKASSFVVRYDALWLVIYATGVGEAEYLLLREEAAHTPIETTFDRVFFIDAERKVAEVPVATPS